MKTLVFLLWADVRHHSRRLMLVGLGLTLATTLFVLLCALGLGLRQGLLQQWGQKLPGHMVEVKPQSVQVGPLELSLGGLLGDAPLTLAHLEALRHLPHVRAAHPVLDVSLPMAAEGGAALFGRPLTTQIFMSALPEALVGDAFADRPQGPIPVVLHDSLVALYNGTVASALQTPQLSPEALVGLSFDLVMGRSPLMPTAGEGLRGRHRAKIVGLSPFALPLGISVPWQAGQRLLQTYGGAQQGDDQPLRAVLLEVDEAQALPSLQREVATLGLHIDNHAQEVADLLSTMVVVLGMFGLLGLLLTGVAMVYAFGGYVEARGRELALVRTVGATPTFVLTWMLVEALCLGLLSGGLGTALAAACVQGGPHFWGPALEHVPLLPKPLLLMPWPLGAAAVALTASTAVLGALGPAWRGARSPLCEPTHAG